MRLATGAHAWLALGLTHGGPKGLTSKVHLLQVHDTAGASQGRIMAAA